MKSPRERTSCPVCGKDVAISKAGKIADHGGVSFNRSEVGGHGGVRCLASFTKGGTDLVKRLEGLVHRGERDLKWAQSDGRPSSEISERRVELQNHKCLLAKFR